MKLSQRLFHVVVTRLLEKLDLVLSLQYFFCQFQTTSSSIFACKESEHKFIHIVDMMDILIRINDNQIPSVTLILLIGIFRCQDVYFRTSGCQMTCIRYGYAKKNAWILPFVNSAKNRLTSMGKSALDSHAKGKKHMDMISILCSEGQECNILFVHQCVPLIHLPHLM